MSVPQMQMTDAGNQLLARALVGETLTFTRIAVGDGTLTSQGQIAGLSGLIHQIVSIPATTKQRKGNTVTLRGEMVIPSGVNSFRWREQGLFAKIGNETEVLYAYINFLEDGEIIKPSDGAERAISVSVSVGDAPNVTVTLTPMAQVEVAVGPAEQIDDISAGLLLVPYTHNGAMDDEWAQDPTTVQGTGAVCAVEGGQLHLKAGSGNGNNATPGASDCPAVFVNETASAELGEVTGAKALELAFTPLSDKATSRFGVYLNYKDTGNGFFVGYDPDGWYWQVYNGGTGSWYSGTRTAAPEAGQEVVLRLEWSGTTLSSATVNGASIFPSVGFSGANAERAGRIGLKLSGWGGVVTEVKVSRCDYTIEEVA